MGPAASSPSRSDSSLRARSAGAPRSTSGSRPTSGASARIGRARSTGRIGPAATSGLEAVFVTVEPWNEWIATMMYDPAEGEPDLSEETLKRRIHDIIGDQSVGIEILNVGKWLINGQFARSYSSGRVFCMGDAVHRHSPANGLGANVSMLD